MNLNLKNYRNSVYACWIGKNIGGTMGTPYEGKRELLDIQGFATAPGVVLPNDDLDLQLIWLHLVEQLGPTAINAASLGEAWLSFICPTWNEYGIGKTNMRLGLYPPMSGDYQNDWKNSNGAWIRTEVWACMAPGCPDIAAKYAMEDAKVDHGAGEGTYAAAFVAAMQSAAFAIKDIRRCIEIGLLRIPEACRVADSVRTVLRCYDEGKSAVETRNIILNRNADIGNGWFEAPSNVAYTILGLLYGEGDFKKSMITAINCGDDTDCTGATVGATLGILGGIEKIPADWREHIGDEIVTVTLTTWSGGHKLPKTCTELTNRVAAQAPHLLFANKASMTLTDSPDDLPQNFEEQLFKLQKYSLLGTALKPYSMRFQIGFMEAEVTLDGAPEIAPMQEKKLHITFFNTLRAYDPMLYNLSLRWWLPDGFAVEGKQRVTLMHRNAHQNGRAEADFTLRAGETVSASNRCVLEVTADGRPTAMYIPVVLLG